jgi:pyruvate formate lyase activating enzyme
MILEFRTLLAESKKQENNSSNCNLQTGEKMIFNIQKFSTQDGKGIRTVVFFKGCPLECLWCSNPESQSFNSELMYEKAKCIDCSECVDLTDGKEIIKENIGLRINYSIIKDAGRYREICPAKALSVIGMRKEIHEVVNEILKDKQFYKNSGGGVTISGGEPFSQPAYLKELLSELKDQDININVETCLHVKWENIEMNLKYIECILADLKHTDSGKYKKYTGGNVELPLENFKKLSEDGVSIRCRVPVIPKFNDTENEMIDIINFAASLKNIKNIDFIPYHRYGKGKYKSLSRNYDFSDKEYEIKEEKLKLFLQIAEGKGLKAEISA